MKKLNIGIIAHVDAGKTTLTENILFLGGAIAKAGRVDKGDTITDSMAVERRRGISVRAAATSFYRNGIKFNLIDTPGHVDFIAEVERNLAVLDGVVLVISAKEGLQSQTRILMDTIKSRNIPTAIFINKIDRMGADVGQIVRETNEYMGNRLIVTQKITADGLVHNLTHEELMASDTLYSYDDELMTKFANDEEILPTDFYNSLTRHTQKGSLYPVFFGSALYGIGVEYLLDALPHFLPFAKINTTSPLSAVVFKVDNSGKRRLAYVRLYSGRINYREPINFRGMAHQITKLSALENGKLANASTIEAGDIAVLYFGNLMVGDIIGEPNSNTRSIRLGRPTLSVEVTPENPDQRSELYKALVSLADEDPLLSFNGQNAMTVQLFGEIQLEILREVLAERYNIATELTVARTIHTETISEQASAVTPISKTFFNAGVGFSIAPLPRGSGVEYVSAVPYGELEKSFQVAVEEAVFTTCSNGIFGWEVTDIKVVFDHSDYDSVSGTPSAFRNLVPLVLMEAIKKAEPILLEPVCNYELRTPSGVASKALYDLRMMNATVDRTETMPGDMMVIAGQVPADACRDYGTKVGSYTEGRGVFLTKFSGYREAKFDENKVNKDGINPAANEALYMMQKLGAR